MKLVDGKNPEISNEDYHGDREYVSSSGLKLVKKDPREYHKRYILGISEYKTSEALVFGTLCHTLLLEPEKYEEEYAIVSGRKGSKKYDEELKLAKGKTVIKDIQYCEASHLINLCKKDSQVTPLITGGVAEQTFATELRGVKVKVRCDYLKSGQIIDLKTTGNASDYHSFQHTIDKYDYDLSAALYKDVVEQITGLNHDFYFIVASKSKLTVDVYRASPKLIQAGRDKYMRAIDIMKHHMENEWKFGIRDIDPLDSDGGITL